MGKNRAAVVFAEREVPKTKRMEPKKQTDLVWGEAAKGTSHVVDATDAGLAIPGNCLYRDAAGSSQGGAVFPQQSHRLSANCSVVALKNITQFG